MFRLVQELAADGFPVAVACRVLKVSTSGFYEWRGRPTSEHVRQGAQLANTIAAIHTSSRQTYGGAPHPRHGQQVVTDTYAQHPWTSPSS